ncbi:hypothetical protein [Microbulbifer sp. JMSA003]|uniref:hypothetical protein n=1 Tax=Microbulbifer sp. JMSA003 TaxID=3243369 RepID=UPI0040390163
MIKDRFFGVFFALSIMLLAMSSNALSLLEPKVYTCNDCTSFSRLAEQKASQNVDNRFYIIDVENGIVKAYIGVTQIVDFEIVGAVALQITVDAEFQTKFDNLVDARREVIAYINNTSGEVDVPSYIAGSAWDLSGSTRVQNNIGDLIYENLELRSKISAFVWASVDVSPALDLGEFYITVRFDDGSSSLYKLTGQELQGDGSWKLTFEYEKGSGRDVNNNTVADSKSQFAGEFIFGTENEVLPFLDALSRFGIEVEIFGVISCGPITTTCVGEGPDMVCETKSISC